MNGTGVSENILFTPIYFNSFESSIDTAGWQGYGYALYPDARLGNGKQSLYVSGGCIIPHARKIFQYKSSSSYVKISCWGKGIIAGGAVLLSIQNDPSRIIYCYITDSVWTYYESISTLFCNDGDTLCLELRSGGIVYNSMLVDMITVTKNIVR